jgi:hypothetical protein
MEINQYDLPFVFGAPIGVWEGPDHAVRRPYQRVFHQEISSRGLHFHATGHGGKAMERMISEGQLDTALGVTTT